MVLGTSCNHDGCNGIVCHYEPVVTMELIGTSYSWCTRPRIAALFIRYEHNRRWRGHLSIARLLSLYDFQIFTSEIRAAKHIALYLLRVFFRQWNLANSEHKSHFRYIDFFTDFWWIVSAIQLVIIINSPPSIFLLFSLRFILFKTGLPYNLYLSLRFCVWKVFYTSLQFYCK